MKKVFKNKPNESIKIGNNEFWISRSVAIVGLLLFKTNNETFVLLELRSEKMDSPNLWCLPCGYIDYSETGWECLLREVYEETGFDISENEEFIIYDNDKQPYFVNTDPSENRQNIALRYVLIFNDFLPHVENYKNDEIIKNSLVNIKNIDKYQFAFHHDKVIKDFIEKHIKNDNINNDKPVLVGHLNKEFGYHGFYKTPVGTKVFEFKDKYQFEILPISGNVPVIQKFYKEDLKKCIEFI